MSGAADVLIVPYQDGPYLVRGPVLLRDQEGREIALNRSPVALCRCGKSRMRPFCDGTHRLIRFEAPSPLEARWPGASSAASLPAKQRIVQGPRPGQVVAGGARVLAARSALDGVSRRLASMLQARSTSAGEHVMISSLEPLIGAARLLVGLSGSEITPEQADARLRAPCACLVRAALAALSSIRADADPGPEDLRRELNEVLALLEPDNVDQA